LESHLCSTVRLAGPAAECSWESNEGADRADTPVLWWPLYRPRFEVHRHGAKRDPFEGLREACRLRDAALPAADPSDGGHQQGGSDPPLGLRPALAGGGRSPLADDRDRDKQRSRSKTRRCEGLATVANTARDKMLLVPCIKPRGARARNRAWIVSLTRLAAGIGAAFSHGARRGQGCPRCARRRCRP
jgi:hypothetical protein